ncbi:hypothetical protein L5F43_06975 [Aliarcobacter butzleri]|uniref:hypothetical protein n=1 Tax=Aliarcobacter butzleri TaxID=28197 RepID=UPI001EDC2C68|nr:hypothetical protein [Aliarcobacter butzleri]MCG3706234.1 hypothetical protein [Aliarcobacter butzleri]
MENNEIDKAAKLVIEYISKELGDGKSKISIIEYLTHNLNFNYEQANTLINKVERANLKSNKSLFKTIIFPLILFIFVNAALWIGQEVYYKEDMNKCENIKTELLSLEKELHDLKNNLAIIENKKKDIEKINISNNYSKVSPKEYNMLVDEYNKNVPIYNNMMNIEKEKIDLYNELVNEYNILAKNAYSRWWLLPFPIPGSHSPHIN